MASNTSGINGTTQAPTVPPPPAQQIQAPNADYLFYEIIYDITEFLFAISVVSAFFTVLTFLIFPRIRTYPIKLIMYLCLTIIIGHSSFCIAPYFSSSNAPYPFICTIFGAVIHYFLLANFFWCFCIAFNFYQMIVKRNSGTRALEKYYHLLGWGTPCISVLVVAGLFMYGQTSPENGTCYIRGPRFFGDELGNTLVFATFFLPGLLLTSANAVLFFFVASEIHGTLSKAPDSEQREKTKEFRVLMSIFVTVGLSWIFGFLNSIVSQFDVIKYIMLVLMTIFTPLQGFFIFVAYCINKKVQLKWMSLFSCLPCCDVEVQGGTGKTGTTGTASTRGGAGYSSSSASYSSSSMASRG